APAVRQPGHLDRDARDLRAVRARRARVDAPRPERYGRPRPLDRAADGAGQPRARSPPPRRLARQPRGRDPDLPRPGRRRRSAQRLLGRGAPLPAGDRDALHLPRDPRREPEADEPAGHGADRELDDPARAQGRPPSGAGDPDCSRPARLARRPAAPVLRAPDGDRRRRRDRVLERRRRDRRPDHRLLARRRVRRRRRDRADGGLPVGRPEHRSLLRAHRPGRGRAGRHARRPRRSRRPARLALRRDDPLPRPEPARRGPCRIHLEPGRLRASPARRRRPLDDREPAAAEGGSRMTATLRRVGEWQREYPLAQALVVVAAFVWGASSIPGFTSKLSVYAMLVLASLLGVAAVGQTLTILVGGLDISIAPWIGAGATVTVELHRRGWSSVWIILVLVVCAVVVGGAAGLISFRFRVQSLIVTLATGAIVAGGVQV